MLCLDLCFVGGKLSFMMKLSVSYYHETFGKTQSYKVSCGTVLHKILKRNYSLKINFVEVLEQSMK